MDGKKQRVEESVFGELKNGDWYRRTSEKVKDDWGENVYPLVINFGMDATELSAGGHATATPMYAIIGNLSI